MNQLRTPARSTKTSAPYAMSFFSLTLLLTLTPALGMGPMMLADESGYSVQCGECDAARCPELNYCEGTPIKDSCNCCTVCSSPKYQPHVSMVGESECEKVKCPKFQMCVANMQGLPLCKCPSEFLCRSNRKRPVCGTDGKTYESKCQMRIASCNQGMMIRKKHRGACTAEDEKDGEIFKRKMRRRLRRRRRRRQKMEMEEAAAAKGDGKIGSGKDGGDGDVEAGGGGLTSSFGTGQGGVFDSDGQSSKLAEPNTDIAGNSKKENKRSKKDGRSASRKERRRKRKRKQRKMKKGKRKEKKEKRRRRRKRQHRPRSRSKRHRVRNTRYLDDAEARERAFAEAFGHSTWWA